MCGESLYRTNVQNRLSINQLSLLITISELRNCARYVNLFWRYKIFFILNARKYRKCRKLVFQLFSYSNPEIMLLSCYRTEMKVIFSESLIFKAQISDEILHFQRMEGENFFLQALFQVFFTITLGAFFPKYYFECQILFLVYRLLWRVNKGTK